ncbi:MAG: helix-turn-helix domain-containing protein [Legionellales bacterium]|nr:helix-turn-helix domain-containing protein [Legionellales bacterium]
MTAIHLSISLTTLYSIYFATPMPDKPFQIACDNCSLANLCMPMGLSQAEIQRFDHFIQREKIFHKGDTIFRQGDPFHTIAVVRSGALKLYQLDEEGELTGLQFALAGEIVGLDGIKDEQYHLSAIAIETTAICQITYQDLLHLAQEIPSLQKSLFSLFSQQLNHHYHVNLNATAEQRFAKFLLSISARVARRGYSATQFNLSMSRQDIACYLGLATETVSRLFKRFSDENILAVKKREIKIHDLRQLQIISCGHSHP